ncbi:MAG: methylmalonyl-CoA mutase family protein [Desulfobacterales bacterium]|nr:methylmalonyl-CoA mutase family protein [Desulfobacterales bacterium]
MRPTCWNMGTSSTAPRSSPARRKLLEEAAQAELDRVLDMGGAVEALENGYMKRSLVESNARRIREIETGQPGRRRRQPLHRGRARPP